MNISGKAQEIWTGMSEHGKFRCARLLALPGRGQSWICSEATPRTVTFEGFSGGKGFILHVRADTQQAQKMSEPKTRDPGFLCSRLGITRNDTTGC